MRFARASLGVLLGAVAMAGCAAISGLSDLEKVDCLDDCEGGVDGTTGDERDTDAASDSPIVPIDSAPDAGLDSADDTAPPDDTGAPDSGTDASDAAVDAPPDCGAINTVKQCSACGVACDTTNASDAGCADASTCTYVCKPGFADCQSGAPNANGCETPTNTVTNCGACNVKCDTTNSSGASCNGTTCLYTGCLNGLTDCDKTPPDTNGCDTNTATDPNNCGGCGVKCDTVHSTGAVCVAGKCQYSGCATGFADCNTTGTDADGCETPTTTLQNCGGCGNACDTVHSQGASCNGTTCNYTGCVSGWGDCNKIAPNTNGCETPTTGTNNCGTCNNVCASGTQSCTNGSCLACAAGKADCNGATAPDSDGCECTTATAATQGTIGGCCGTGCQTKHNNGYAGNYFDCNPLSTYNSTTATEAATSDTTHAGTITVGTCGSGANTQSAVFKTTGNGSTGVCTSWVFAGTGTFNNVNLANTVGTVYTSSGTGTDTGCFCSLGTTPQWN